MQPVIAPRVRVMQGLNPDHCAVLNALARSRQIIVVPGGEGCKVDGQDEEVLERFAHREDMSKRSEVMLALALMGQAVCLGQAVRILG